MSHYNKLLVVIDPTVDEQKALSRAAEINQKHPCEITVFLSIYDFSYEMTTMLSPDERDNMRNAVLDERKEWIKELVNEAGLDGESIDIDVVWHNRPFESIIRKVISGNYDLVVKGTHQHDVLKSVIFTPTDWHLLRKCPSAVLLVKEHAWPEHSKVVAAVSAGTDDPAHESLNSVIIEHGSFMARLLNSDIHLVNAYPPTPMNIAVEIPEFDPNEYNSNMKHHHTENVEKLAVESDINVNNTHVIEGMPEDVIPRIASKLDAELVVMGTIGRSGLSATLIGNTAEHVIDNINCDLLALKPLGYTSPMSV